MEDKIRNVLGTMLCSSPGDTRNEMYDFMCQNLGFTSDIQKRLIDLAMDSTTLLDETIGETKVRELLCLIQLTHEAQVEAMDQIDQELRQIIKPEEKQGASSPS